MLRTFARTAVLAATLASGAAYANDIFLQPGDSITIGTDRVTCGAAQPTSVVGLWHCTNGTGTCGAADWTFTGDGRVDTVTAEGTFTELGSSVHILWTESNTTNDCTLDTMYLMTCRYQFGTVILSR